MEEVTADVVEATGELKLEMELGDVTELMQPLMIELEWIELFLLDQQRKWFLEAKSTPEGKMLSRRLEIASQCLEYEINLVDVTVLP